MTGAVWRATWPAASGQTGTSRQARMSSPTSVIFSTSSHSSVWRRRSSVGQEHDRHGVTAGRRAAGSRHTARKNRSGICTSIPAPSPVSASAPSAPRCSMLASAAQAPPDGLVRRDAVETGHQRDPAAVVLVSGVVKALHWLRRLVHQKWLSVWQPQMAPLLEEAREFWTVPRG